MAQMTFQEYRESIGAIPPSDHCPVAKMLHLFQGKWTIRVLFELSKVDAIRFGDLKRQIPGITNTMLTSTLRYLEENKLVSRIQYNEIPPHVEYALSEAGQNLYPVFVEFANWSLKYLK